MHRIRVIGRLTALLTGLASALLAATAIPAFAHPIPPDGGDGTVAPASPLPVHTVVVGGMPGWQIADIAVGAAATAAVVAVFLDRTRAARQPMVTLQPLAVPHK
jgi:hypothetical protein